MLEWLKEHRNHIEFALFIGFIGLMFFGVTYVTAHVTDWVGAAMGIKP